MAEVEDKAQAEAVPEPIEDSKKLPDVFWETAALTDVGCAREQNEDAFLVADLTARTREGPAQRTQVGARGVLLVVCDGMGGAAAGEVASALAVDVVFHEMSAAPEGIDRTVTARLFRRAVRTANRRLVEEAKLDPKRRGMGTTLSGAVLCQGSLVLAQIGDSRAYLFRSGVLVQITRDQSVVSALVNAGRLTPEEAKNFVHANVILQALGVADDVEVSLSVSELRRGDRLLLCSDGLHGPIGDGGIQEALAASERLEENVAELIARARKAGGPDNITAVMARFDGDALPAARDVDDLPKFLEFDPAEEGERSVTTTSRVARRLAARAGVGTDPGPSPLPATGQHPIIRRADVARAAARSLGAEPGRLAPAQAAVAERSRLGLLAWLIAGVAILALAAVFLWFRLR
jgi:PPM family protein phosphatase